MTDTDLRRLERLAQADPAQRPAWLAARLRAGELSRERLELAAYCGDEAALALVGTQRIRYSTFRAHRLGVPLELWARGLSRWGHQVQVRAGLAAALEAFRRWSVCGAGPQGCAHGCASAEECNRLVQAARSALDAVRAWLADPSEAHRLLCDRLVERDLNAQRPGLSLCESIAEEEDREGMIELEVEDAAQATSEQAVRQAMQRELIAWALGTPGRAA